MTHYTNTGNPIDFPKKKDIPMLEKFAAQSLVEHDGELIFSKEKFAGLIVRECAQHAVEFNNNNQSLPDKVMRGNLYRVSDYIKDRMGVEE